MAIFFLMVINYSQIQISKLASKPLLYQKIQINEIMEERSKKPQLGGQKHPSPFSKSYKVIKNDHYHNQAYNQYKNSGATAAGQQEIFYEEDAIFLNKKEGGGGGPPTASRKNNNNVYISLGANSIHQDQNQNHYYYAAHEREMGRRFTTANDDGDDEQQDDGLQSIETPHLTIKTNNMHQPVASNYFSTKNNNQHQAQPQSSTMRGRGSYKFSETTSPLASLKNGSRTTKAAGAVHDQEINQNKMLITADLKNGIRTQQSYERVEHLQPKILQNSGHPKVPKKQTSIYCQQRANVPKFKYQKGGAAAGVFSMNSTKECTFCCGSNPNTAIHAQHSSCFLNSNNSSIGNHVNNKQQRPIPPQNFIMGNLGRKYANCHVEFENLKVVNDLIYNEQTHVVSIFKDYLILDDINEFLKRSYKCETESQVRLPKLCEFYQKYSQVFPNFVSLPESKYMFRNIQRKQRLIDEQFNLMQKNGGEAATGAAGGGDSHRKEKASLMHSANKLFSTGFIDSVLNQKNCTTMTDEDWTGKRLEAQEKRYLESARRLDKNQRTDRADSVMPFQMENLDLLVQKFMHKDTESTIHLNTSLGNLGDEILGNTFTKENKSIKNSMDADIGVINDGQSANQTSAALDSLGNRMSIISAQTVSFQQSQTSGAPSAVTKPRTMTSKTGLTKAQQVRMSGKKQKAGSSAASLRKQTNYGVKPTTHASVQSLIQQQHLQKSATATSVVKQKNGQLVSQNQIQAQIETGKVFTHQLSQNILGRTGLQKQTLSPSEATRSKKTPSKDEQRFLREKYLECDIGGKSSEKRVETNSKKLSANVDSASQSPVEGILNPLSSQPLLSKTSMNQKTTQPGSSLGFFKQRSSEVGIGSATPTQHLYHSKQTSFKGAAAAGATTKILPQLNLIQQQVEQDYYSSGFRTNLAQQQPQKGQFFRSQTAMNSVQNSTRQTMLVNQHQKTKHVSRERSPPLMQDTKQNLKKGKKSPHQKKDRRAVPGIKNNQNELEEQKPSQYYKGKSSVNSAKNLNNKQRSPKQSLNSRIVKPGESKTSLAMTGPVFQDPMTPSLQQQQQQQQQRDNDKPLSSHGGERSYHQGGGILHREKFYSQTEINEADEDYPEDEVADEIPDDHLHQHHHHHVDEDTEDEQDVLKSDDEEGHIHDSKEKTLSVREKLRPVDMLPTHGGAFQEEDSYNMQMISNKPRAQTTMNYHPNNGLITGAKRQLSGQNQYDPALFSHQSIQLKQKQSNAVATSISNYGSERQKPQKSTSQAKPASLSSTQQPAITQVRRSLQTEIDLRPTITDTNPTSTKSRQQAKQLSSQKCQLPLGQTQAANRPNTNLVTRQSLSIRSKFSRENSVSSRQDTQPLSQNQIKPIAVHDSKQRFYEASMKLGGKALVGSQSQAANRLQQTLTSSLRSSVEPNKIASQQQQHQIASKIPNSVATSAQASMLAVSRYPNSTKTTSNNSAIKRQHHGQQQSYKADLTSRLASNLINEQYHHLAKKKSSHQQQEATTSSLKQQIKSNSKLTAAASNGTKLGAKTGSFVKVATTTTTNTTSGYNNAINSNRSGTQQSGGGGSNNHQQAAVVVPTWKRKSLNFQSPHAGVSQPSHYAQGKKLSVETLSKFQAMGSGKASYLTNVGIAATQNTLNNSSRNFTSPYASQNQNKRFMPKDSSGGSLPKTKVMSKSPPTSEKDSLLAQQRNLMKTSNQNLSLQQQLSQINKQLALSQVQTSSFRQTAGVSPQSNNSVYKKKNTTSTVAVLTPATSNPGSLIHTGEKQKHRKSQDRANYDISSNKSLQRSYQQNTLKQSIVAAQALISLPASKNQQLKNLQSQICRTQANTGLKASKQQHNNFATIDGKPKHQVKVGQFLGQQRNAHKHNAGTLSPQALQPSFASKTMSKQMKVGGTVTSDRSNKSQRGTNPVGSVQINIFQSSTGELRKAVTSMEEVKMTSCATGPGGGAGSHLTKGITPVGNSRLQSKKQSISGKQLKKSVATAVHSSKALSLSPPNAAGQIYERKMKR